MRTSFFLPVLVAGFGTLAAAAPLTQSTFTDVIKDVNVVAADTKAVLPAQVNGLFKSPDLVRTGPDSRAELTAADQTITRVGANSVFSFDSAGRTVNLQQGSVLFHSPSGKGGGTISSGGASAAVLGTTIIVSATADGGFKFIVLEGKGKATLSNGRSASLKAGQLVFVLPGGKDFSAVLDINLGKLAGGSLLVKGFSHELPSWPLIQAVIARQDHDLSTGRAADTGDSADAVARRRPSSSKGMNAMDNTSYQAAVAPAMSLEQVEQVEQLGIIPPGLNPGGRGITVIGSK